jgi:hypothetical protein
MKRAGLAFLLFLSALFGSATAMANCLNLSLIPWPTSGWSADFSTYCIRGSVSSQVSSTASASDFEYRATIKLSNDGQPDPASQGGLVFRSQNNTYLQGYMVLIHHLPNADDRVELYKNGAMLTSAVATINFNTPYQLRVSAFGSAIKVYLGGTLVINATDGTYTSGAFGLFRAGTTVDFTDIFTDIPTLHSSEIGYQTYGQKRAMIQSGSGAYAGASFTLRDASTNATVFTGTAAANQTKWGRSFNVLDFSTFTTPGQYRVAVTIGATTLTSSAFTIGATPLLDTQMYQIAVNQLNQRFPSPTATPGFAGAYLPSNRTTINDLIYSNSSNPLYPYRAPQSGDYVPQIWRDCSSNYAEVQSVGTTVLGLIELYEKNLQNSSRFTSTQVADLMANAQLGVDYLVSLQESHPGDALRDGRLRHSTLVNVEDNAWWAGNVHIWNDTVFGAGVLARASAALANMADRTSNPTLEASLRASAAAALIAAKRAWVNADYRPYYLAEDLDTSYIPGYNFGTFWPWTDWRVMARAMYGVTDASWDMATTLTRTTGYDALRSRELISFLNASTLLYQVTDETGSARTKYLTTAKSVASELATRQYGTPDTPLDGVYGMFREFASINTPAANAFLMESAQAGMTHIGNYQFTSLQGFIDLLALAPSDADTAKWHRVIELWSNSYQGAAAARNPFGIAPNTVYQSTQGSSGSAAVYWFGNHLHGGNEIPGQAARSLLQVGNYLNDIGYYSLAVANAQFYAGLNPGIGATHEPSSLIKAVGAKSLIGTYMEGSAPNGSIGNGYTSTGNFSQSFYTSYDSNETIPADGFGADVGTVGQESWILHSHSYVMAAASVEAPFQLKVTTQSGSGTPLSGVGVWVEYPGTGLSTQTFTTGVDGTVSIATAHLGQNAVVRLKRSGYADYLASVATVGGGTYSWLVDYQDYVGVGVSGLPATLTASTSYPVTLTVMDYGDQSDPVQASFTFAGLSSGTSGTTLASTSGYNNSTGANRTRTFNFNVTAGGANQAYVLRTRVSSGANVTIVNKTGKIQ